MATFIGSKKLSSSEQKAFKKAIKEGKTGRQAIKEAEKQTSTKTTSKTTGRITAGSIGLTGEEVAKIVEQKGGAKKVTSSDIETKAGEKLQKQTGIKRSAAKEIVSGRFMVDDNLAVVKTGSKTELATGKAADILIESRKGRITAGSIGLTGEEVARLEKERKKFQTKQKQKELIFSPLTTSPIQTALEKQKNIISKPKQQKPEGFIETKLFNINKNIQTQSNKLKAISQELSSSFDRQSKVLSKQGTITQEEKNVLKDQKEISLKRELELFGGVALGTGALIGLGVAEGVAGSALFAKQALKEPGKATLEIINIPKQAKLAGQRIIQEPISGVTAVGTQAFIFKKAFTKTSAALISRKPTVVTGRTTIRGISLKQITPTITPVPFPENIKLKGKAGLTFDRVLKASEQPSAAVGSVLRPREIAFTIERGKAGGINVTRTSFPLSGKTTIQLFKGRKTTIIDFVEGKPTAQLKTVISTKKGIRSEKLTVPVETKGTFTEPKITGVKVKTRQEIIKQPGIEKIETKAGVIKVPSRGAAIQRILTQQKKTIRTERLKPLSKDITVQKITAKQNLFKFSRATLQRDVDIAGFFEQPTGKQAAQVITSKGVRPKFKFSKGIDIRQNRITPLTDVKKFFDLDKNIFRQGQVVRKRFQPKEVIEETTKQEILFETDIFKKSRLKEQSLRLAKDKKAEIVTKKLTQVEQPKVGIERLKPQIKGTRLKLPKDFPEVSISRTRPKGIPSYKATPRTDIKKASARLTSPESRQDFKDITKDLQKPIQSSITQPIQRPIKKSIIQPIQKPIQRTIQRPIQKPITRIPISSFKFKFPTPKPKKFPLIIPQSMGRRKEGFSLKQKIEPTFKQPKDFTRSAFGAAFNLKPTKQRKAVITGLRI